MTDHELTERWRFENKGESIAEFCYRIGKESVVFDKKFEKAVKHLSNEYKKALYNERIHDPIAYALYHTWKKFDR